MSVFIYEHLTSGAMLDSACSESLLHEGDVMLQSLIGDLLAYDVPILTMRDHRLPPLTAHAQLTPITIENTASYQAGWLASLKQASAALIIAPENDAILLSLTQQAEQTGVRLLSCQSEAIAVAGDKWRCFEVLQSHAIATPPTFTVSQWLNATHNDQQWVLKPRDGVGCEQTYLLNTDNLMKRTAVLSAPENWIIQPYLSGQTLSLSLFVSPQAVSVFSVNQQIITEQASQLSLSHCLTKQSLLATEIAESLAQQVVHVIPGLNGFVGIDLIQQDDKLWVIEVNPRLTSSYAEAPIRAEANPAQPLYEQLIAGLDDHN